jgi:hypothetical protein
MEDLNRFDWSNDVFMLAFARLFSKGSGSLRVGSSVKVGDTGEGVRVGCNGVFVGGIGLSSQDRAVP